MAARELADAKCAVIFALANLPSGRAISAVRTTTPVVLLAIEYDPLEAGIVKSLARPGGNITGVFSATNKVQAAILLTSPNMVGVRREMSAFFVEQSIPAFVPNFMAAEAGSLMSYGVSFAQVARRAAGMAERILKGANPGELPIEQIDEFSLTVNMRTARALGIKVPYSVMARSTTVLE